MDLGAVVHRIGELTVLQHVDDPAHRFLGIVLYVLHIGAYDIQPEMSDHAAQFRHALLVGGDLRLDVGDVLIRVARRVPARGQQVVESRLAERAPLDQQEIVDQHAFFFDDGAVRRHRTRGQAADIGVMATGADIEQDVLARLVEDRGHDGDVGQMGAAIIGRVQHVDVAGIDAARIVVDHGADALAHRAQMHRHMRCVGDQCAAGVEDGAGEIDTFLDVHRIGRVLQREAHLLGDRHEEIVEDLQHHRIDGGADGRAPGQRHDARQHQVAARVHLGLPSGLNQGGGGGLADDRRAVDLLAVRHVAAVVDRRVVLLTRHVAAYGRQGPGPAALRRGDAAGPLADIAGRADRLDGGGFHHQRLPGHDEAVALAVRLLERRLHIRGRAVFDLDRGIRALIFQMQPAQHGAAAWRDLLAGQLAVGLGRQVAQHRFERRAQRLGQPLLDRFFAQRPHVCQAHAISRQYAREGMQIDRLHAQRISHQAGMLAARAAKTAERIVGHVVTALHRDFLDRVGHILDRDLQETIRDLDGRTLVAGRRLHFFGQRGELDAYGVGIQGLVLIGTEHAGKELRLQLAQHDVAVGDGQRPATPVTGRPRICAGGLRSDAIARAVEDTHRAAARRHRMDSHHRRAHAYARDQGLEGALIFAVVMRHVGRGAAHIEGDQLVETGLPGRTYTADDAAGRTGQDRILALEHGRVGQPAAGLHEHQPYVPNLLGDLVHIAAQDRRQIGVDDRGVAAPDQLDQRAGPVAGGNLRETDFTGDLHHCLLMVGITVAMHQDDGDGAIALVPGRLQRRAGCLVVQRGHHAAVVGHALVDLDDILVEQFGQHHMAVEQAGSRLIADAQRVPETLCDGQQGALALALQERIGGHRGAHLDSLDRVGGDRRVLRQP